MRKGAWLNRPIIIHQRPATNAYDVEVARIKGIVDSIHEVLLDCTTSGRIARNELIKMIGGK